MLGIDMTKISRFDSPKETMIKKILHPNEIEQYHKSEDKQLFLSSRFAIKEAIFKSDNKYFHFNKIEIKKKGRTYLYPGYIISTTKEDNYYIAIVMKEK